MFGELAFLLDCFGTFIFALTGAVKGIQKHLDIFGVTVLACCVGVAGGLMRDSALNIIANSIIHQEYFIICILTGIICFIIPTNYLKYDKLITICDAVGLGVFTSIGCIKAASLNLGLIGIIFSGVITAVGGGIVRDILSGDCPPTILKTDFYATASLIGTLTFFLLNSCSISLTLSFFIVMTIVITIRLLAFHFNIQLPKK